MKAVLKYPGSKWGMAKWIACFFPKHHSYLEPYFGSGAVLFNKNRSNIETVNDLDGNIVNLFEQMRKDPERFAKEIWLTPYAREVYEKAMKSETKDNFERAMNFYITLQMSHGYRIREEEKSGFKIDKQARERAYATRRWCEMPNASLKSQRGLEEYR